MTMRDRTWEARKARREVTQLLRRMKELRRELKSLDPRGGSDVDLKERELERLRWRLAEAVRRAASADGGAAA